MASFFSSARRLALKRNLSSLHPVTDEEKAAPSAASAAAPGPAGLASAPTVTITSGSGDPSPTTSAATPLGASGRGAPPGTDENDRLAHFRLMLGIHSHPDTGFIGSGTRPADNIGLYARVVHNEQKAKDSYKVFSTVINACYFLQIIVAAALTALGAANADHQAITAFGAINTIIAGFLTYLKGSGLPGRLKYFGGEWKKVREHIEQRERDLSNPNADHDVHESIQAVRDHYESTLRDVQVNTPDSYNSVTGGARGIMQESPGKLEKLAGQIDTHKIDGAVNKIKEMEETFKRLSHRLEGKSVSDLHADEKIDAVLTKADEHIDKAAHDAAQAAGDQGKKALAGVLEKNIMEKLR